jgi:hypothetical protein
VPKKRKMWKIGFVWFVFALLEVQFEVYRDIFAP